MAEGSWQPPAPSRASVPAELRELPGWLLWRAEYNPGSDKPLKIPYWIDGCKRHGQQGSPEDRAKLTTFAAAVDAAARRGFDGVGLALLPEFGIVAFDFDNCIDDSGALHPEVQHVVCRTYAEKWPGRQGLFQGRPGQPEESGRRIPLRGGDILKFWLRDRDRGRASIRRIPGHWGHGRAN